ncbi:hypothetical protein Dimus_032118 [Dionaea muscipula]
MSSACWCSLSLAAAAALTCCRAELGDEEARTSFYAWRWLMLSTRLRSAGVHTPCIPRFALLGSSAFWPDLVLSSCFVGRVHPGVSPCMAAAWSITELGHAEPILCSAFCAEFGGNLLMGSLLELGCVGGKGEVGRSMVIMSPAMLREGNESCPPCELGEGDALRVSGKGVIPCASEEGATSRGLMGVPPSYPLAARPEGRSPKKLRIKLKSRSLGESSQSRPENTTLCVVDAASTLGPRPGRGGGCACRAFK